MISILLKTFFYASPNMSFSEEEVIEYDKLVAKINKVQLLPAQLPFLKYKFLQYLACTEYYVFHGSNNVHIDMFEPREQTLFNSQPTKAVFATSDPLWSMFYAVFDRSKLVGGFRNGCLVYKKRKYHYYSLNESTMENDPWTSRTIYILPKRKFYQSDHAKMHYDEWICHDLVEPIGQLDVEPRDFYFINKIATHGNQDSNIKSFYDC